MQTLLRVRKARQQKKRLQEAAELGEALGISKWAALWMLRKQEEEKQPMQMQEIQQDSLWTRLGSGLSPDADDAEFEAELDDALDAEADNDLPEGGVDTEVDELIAELDRQTAQRETEKAQREEAENQREAERREMEELRARARARRNWSKLRKGGLKVALHTEYERTGIDPKEDLSTRFARIAKKRLDALHRFRSDNPKYPFGPLPQAKVSPRESSSPRRLPSSRPQTATLVAVQQGSLRHQGKAKMLSSEQSVLHASRSEASLQARPLTASPMLQSSLSTINLEDERGGTQYGLGSSAPLPVHLPDCGRSAGTAGAPHGMSPRQQPTLVWQASDANVDADQLVTYSMIERDDGIRPDSAPRGVFRDPLPREAVRLVQRFQMGRLDPSGIQRLRASPSLPGCDRLPSRSSSAGLLRDTAQAGLIETREPVFRSRPLSRPGSRPPNRFESLPPDNHVGSSRDRVSDSHTQPQLTPSVHTTWARRASANAADLRQSTTSSSMQRSLPLTGTTALLGLAPDTLGNFERQSVPVHQQCAAPFTPARLSASVHRPISAPGYVLHTGVLDRHSNREPAAASAAARPGTALQAEPVAGYGDPGPSTGLPPRRSSPSAARSRPDLQLDGPTERPDAKGHGKQRRPVYYVDMG